MENNKRRIDHVDLTGMEITETYTLTENYKELGTVEGETFCLTDVVLEEDIDTLTASEMYELRARYIVEELVQNGVWDDDCIYKDTATWVDDDWMEHIVEVNLYTYIDGEEYLIPCTEWYVTDIELRKVGDRQ